MTAYLSWALAIAALAAAAAFAHGQLVKAGVLRYNRWDRRERGTLEKGDAVPDVALALYEGGETSLSKLWKTKPLFLIFGSCT